MESLVNKRKPPAKVALNRLRLILLTALLLNVSFRIVAIGLQLNTLSSSDMPTILGDFGGTKERFDAFRHSSMALLENALLIPIWKVFLGLVMIGFMTPGLLWNGICQGRLGRFKILFRSGVFFVFFALITVLGGFMETPRLLKESLSDTMIETYLSGAHIDVLKMGTRWILFSLGNTVVQNQPVSSFLVASALEIGYSTWRRQESLWNVTEASALPRSENTEPLFQMAERARFPTDKLHRGSGRGAFYFSTPFDEIICIEPCTLRRPKDELLGVLAHELGHSAQGDCYARLFSDSSFRGIAYNAMYIFFTSKNRLFFELFGYATEPLAGALWNAYILYQIFDVFWIILVNAMEIYKEHDADLYAAAFGYADGLAKFLAAVGYPIVSHPMFSLLHGSHPPVDKRLTRLAVFGNRPNAPISM